MGINRAIGPISIACIAFVIILSASPAAAVDRSKGDYWTYTMSLGSIDFGVPGIDTNGTITYTCVDQDTVSVGGTSYSVNIMRVSGGASGGVDFLGIEASASLGGYVYETQTGIAIVKNDLFFWMNLSIGSGSFQIASRTETENSASYSPPLLSGFDPSSVKPGDSWTETVLSNTTTTEWVNGTMQGTPVAKTVAITFTNVVASAKETVSTEAGDFETLRITSTDNDGNSVVYWWSSEVRNFVKEDTYEQGSTTPVTTMVLKDYKIGSAISLALVASVGGAVLLVALVVLALVLLKRRKPSQPSAYQPGMPRAPPHSPPPGPPGQ